MASSSLSRLSRSSHWPHDLIAICTCGQHAADLRRCCSPQWHATHKQGDEARARSPQLTPCICALHADPHLLHEVQALLQVSAIGFGQLPRCLLAGCRADVWWLQQGLDGLRCSCWLVLRGATCTRHCMQQGMRLLLSSHCSIAAAAAAAGFTLDGSACKEGCLLRWQLCWRHAGPSQHHHRVCDSSLHSTSACS